MPTNTMRTRTTILVFLLALGSLPNTASACLCSGDPEEIIERSEVVFTGLLVQARLVRGWTSAPLPDVEPERVFRRCVWQVEVYDVWKGDVDSLMTVEVDIWSSCAIEGVNPGNEVIIAGNLARDGSVQSVNLCSNSGSTPSNRGRSMTDCDQAPIRSFYMTWGETLKAKLQAADSDTISVDGPIE